MKELETHGRGKNHPREGFKGRNELADITETRGPKQADGAAEGEGTFMTVSKGAATSNGLRTLHLWGRE
jgi:hypothetical protein